MPETDQVFSASFGPSAGAATNDYIISYVQSKSAGDGAFSLQGTFDWMAWIDVGSRFVPVDIMENADRKTETVRLRLLELPTEQMYLRLKLKLAADG